MNKGESTKAMIVEQAARLFNTRGYGSGSMSELMSLTGLKKGGIYNHFGSKEELALAAFDHSIRLMNKKLAEVLQSSDSPAGNIRALLDFYSRFSQNLVMEGGCPLLNTAVEAEQGHPQLKQRVGEVLRGWQAVLCGVIEQGIARGEFRAGAEPGRLAIFIISAIEGGITISRALDDDQVLADTCESVWRYLERELLV